MVDSQEREPLSEESLLTRFPRVRTTRKSAVTQIKIIDAYLHLMEQTDFDKISVSAIVKEAGVTRSTFYAYFTDIYDVLDYVEGEITRHLPAPPTGEIGQLPYGPKRPPRRDRCAEPAWYAEWFAFATYFSYQLYVLLGPTGNPQFAHKMRKALREAHRRQMRNDGHGSVEAEEWLLDGLSDYHLSITRKFVHECREREADDPALRSLARQMGSFLNSIRVGSWYMGYLALSEECGESES